MSPTRSPRASVGPASTGQSAAAIFLKSGEDPTPSRKTRSKRESLRTYQREVLGVDHSKTADEDIGKLNEPDIDIERSAEAEPTSIASGEVANPNAEQHEVGASKVDCEPIQGQPSDFQAEPSPAECSRDEAGLSRADCEPSKRQPSDFQALQPSQPSQAREQSKAAAEEGGVPTVTEPYNGGFGRPSKIHSFTQEACFETCLFQVLKIGSQYMSVHDLDSLLDTHVLVRHLHKMIAWFATVDFSPLREYDPNYATQREIPKERIKMFMACLFHYDLNVANVMRYVDNNYTGGWRDINKMVAKMQGLVDDDLLEQYVRVMTVGAPAHFVAESTRENALLHWRKGNHASVALNLEKVMKAMNKLERNQFVIPLHGWITRFVPNIFLSPQHHGKKNRHIFDGSRRFTPYSVPVNRMTSTRRGVELDCKYGDVLERLLVRIWNLRISYPELDIVLHANDVKSCFRQMKHHPDVMGAFSYLIADLLFLSCGLTFGADFSPPTWEVPRRMAEQLATNLFSTEGLVEKHRKHLDKLKWSKKLGQPAELTPAHASSVHKGVLDEEGKPSNTPHQLFVDDDVYADVFNVERVEQTIASGIEAIFMLLGESDLLKRQDPISWEKLEEMIIHFKNKILGLLINTRKMTVEPPPEYVAAVVKLLSNTWHPGRVTFYLKEIETLAGQLQHIANTAKWLKHLMSHVYTSVAAALKGNKAFLVITNKHFREQLKIAKMQLVDDTSEMEASFAQAETSRQVHNLKRLYRINQTLREELDIIRRALAADWVSKATPIAHLIPDEPDDEAHGDSSLDAAGGWSTSMGFWWYLEWPEEVRKRTLRFVRDGKSEDFIDINCLEYATVLINYAASVHYWITEGNQDTRKIPYPRVLIKADNVSAEIWTIKGCKRSFVGRRLGRLQCAMMINNPVGLDTDHVDTKTNEIADRISRFKRETDTFLGFDKLMQEFPQLKSCRRFHPSKELISCVLDALLSKKLEDPLQVSAQVLRNPGKVTS
jgi:hypothetical protein